MLNMSITGRLYFNSRPSARGDHAAGFAACGVGISIHAPPRGATESRRASPVALQFQFTPLREGRLRCCPCASSIMNFNSRPSARGDSAFLPRRLRHFISIHAPPRGATSPDTTTGRDNHISIHAPPRGATAMRGDSGTSDDISIHAPPRGATFFILSRIPSLTISIHAPPRGATFNRLGVFLGSHISIHAPPRGATNPSNGSHQGRRISIHAPPRGATADWRARVPPEQISIHAPPRGATAGSRQNAPGWTHFNSRPSARGDTATLPNAQDVSSFQFTPLREGRPPRIGRWWGLECISIHAPPRGATTPSVEDDAPEIFQFTPLREGRLHPQRIVHAREISIHAPPRGATSLYLLCWYAENISIHAPPRGATPSSALHSNVYVPFQFTPLREGRPMHDPREYPVSIFQFTPLREGRLPSLAIIPLSILYFNSRPSARGDPSFHHFLNFASTFQFTPLREGRRQRGGKSSPMPRHFNSRPSARGDEEAHQRAREAHISIHAPPRGATVTSISSFKPRSEFQFTPLREGRRARLCQSPASYQFQFTPLREGRPPFFVAVFGLSHFNSRPSARGDASARNVPRKPLISIHAPPRGATKGNVIADERYIISIHAPPRGATATRRGFLTPVLFQFTPLREGRRLAGSPCDVSRHHFNSRPSARGDDGERVRFAAWCYFNSRPSARGDSHFPSSTTERGVFQFTPLREGRLNAVQYEHSQDYFNSRPSARGDPAHPQPCP